MESDGLPLAYAPRILGACGRTRTYEVVRRLISKEGAFAAQPHMQMEISDLKFQIPDFKFKSQMISNLRFQNSDRFVLKNR